MTESAGTPKAAQMVEIRHWIGRVIGSWPGGDIREALVNAVRSGANLDGANLVGANLVGANLDGANLVRANLDGANLVRANLDGANLDGANLVGANLVGANLVGANLVGANLEDGLSWEQYLKEVVPALLTAGGKSLEQVLASGCWECHSWDNCPMAFAFDVHSVSDVPPLYRARASQFVQLFDAKLIPKPVLPNSPTAAP